MPPNNVEGFKAMCAKLIDVLELSLYLWDEGIDIMGKAISGPSDETYRNLIDPGKRMTVQHVGKIRDCGIKRISKLSDSPPNPPSSFLNGEHFRVFYLDQRFPFLLPPLDSDNGFIPIMSAIYEFGQESYRLSFPIALIRFTDDEQHYYCGVGYRFETGWTGGNHDYFHVQPTPHPFKEGPYKGELPIIPGWFPETYPCVPTGARCPVSLLSSVLVSMYGRLGFIKRFSAWDEPSVNRVLKQWWA